MSGVISATSGHAIGYGVFLAIVIGCAALGTALHWWLSHVDAQRANEKEAATETKKEPLVSK